MRLVIADEFDPFVERVGVSNPPHIVQFQRLSNYSSIYELVDGQDKEDDDYCRTYNRLQILALGHRVIDIMASLDKKPVKSYNYRCTSGGLILRTKTAWRDGKKHEVPVQVWDGSYVQSRCMLLCFDVYKSRSLDQTLGFAVKGATTVLVGCRGIEPVDAERATSYSVGFMASRKIGAAAYLEVDVSDRESVKRAVVTTASVLTRTGKYALGDELSSDSEAEEPSRKESAECAIS